MRKWQKNGSEAGRRCRSLFANLDAHAQTPHFVVGTANRSDTTPPEVQPRILSPPFQRVRESARPALRRAMAPQPLFREPPAGDGVPEFGGAGIPPREIDQDRFTSGIGIVHRSQVGRRADERLVHPRHEIARPELRSRSEAIPDERPSRRNRYRRATPSSLSSPATKVIGPSAFRMARSIALIES